MEIEFTCIGLTFLADIKITPYVPARTHGRPENCYPAEGGDISFDSLICISDDAMFLLSGPLSETIVSAALQAVENKKKADFDEVMID